MKKTIVIALTFLSTVAMAEKYSIDTAASKIAWKAGKKVGSFHDGEIKVKSGEIETDKKNVIKSGTVVVDMKTISNLDLKDSPEYQTKLVGHLSNEDFFHVEKHPESTFALKSITPVKGVKDKYTIKGDLTMIGVTKPIEFPAVITFDKKTMTGTAKVEIKRLDWGLKYGSGSIFKSLTADKIINDTFDLTLNLVATKK